MATERNTDRRSTGMRSRNNINREPANNSGTIRNNLERYRSDSVSAVKARQSSKRPESQIRRANQRAQKKQRTKKLIIRLAVTLFVILICVACFLFTYRVFYDTPMDEEAVDVKVEFTITDPEVTDEEIAEQLVEIGVIKDARLYKLRTYIYDANYIPGTYKLSPSYSTEKIINILSGYDYSDGTMEE